MSNKERTFKIPQHNISWFRKKLEKLILKAKKCKCDIPTYTESKPYIKILNCKSPSKKRALKYIDVKVSGIRPSINGWDIIGKIEHHKGGNVLKMMKDLDSGINLSEYYIGTQACDHCQTKRSRKDTYIVINQKNKIMQVGKSCLKDFIGHASPEYYASLSELDWDVELELTRSRDGAGKNELLLTTVEFLKIARSVIRKDEGYKSKKMHDCDSTSSQTSWYFWGSDHGKSTDWSDFCKDIENNYVKESDNKEILDALHHFKNIETNNVFENNMKVLAENEFLSSKDYGICCYILQAFFDFENKKAAWLIKAELESKKDNNFFGKLKERLEFKNLIYIKTNSFDHQYGRTYFHYFEDNNGTSFINKGSKSLKEMSYILTGDTLYKSEAPISGSKFSLKGTIVEHKEYKNRKSTYINRVKLIKIN